MLKKISAFLRDEEGATAIEYGLIVGLISAVIVAILIVMSGNLTALYGAVSNALGVAAGAAG